MGDDTPGQTVPLGLWELDAAGTVLHYEPTKGESSPFRASEVTGKNFFSEVMPAALAGDLREQFAGFMSGHAPAQSLDLHLPGEQGGVRARILLGRVRGRSAAGAAESILVHVRRA